MNARRAVWAMASLGLLFGGGVGAQETPAPDAANAEEPAPFPEGTPTLALPQAVAAALERNFGLLAAADGLTSARLRESAAAAQFHPRLTPSYQRSTDDEQTVGLEASQRLPWTGGTLTASGTFRSLSGADTPLSRTSDLRLVLTQPLLRGFGPTPTDYDLTNSRRGRQAAERQFELQRQGLAELVAQAFYQVVKQRQLVVVSRQSLKRSEDLRKSSEARMNVGLASKLDVLRAEIDASQAEDGMVQAQAALESALEQFRILLGRSPTDPVQPEAVELSEEAELEVEPVEVLIARAKARRLELLESRDQVGDAERTLALARQSLWPQLDLNLGVTQSGFGSSFSQSLKAADTSVNLFVTTSYPLERSADRTARALAEVDLEARRRSQAQREFEVEAEVRAAARDLERIRKSIELQKQAVAFAQQKQRLATLRYQRGLESNFDVVDAERQLVLARTALVGLLTDYQVSRIHLLRVTGALEVDKEFAP